MAKFFQDQSFENNILFQRIELMFEPAKNWQTCTWPMTTDEMVAKVMDEFAIYFDSNPVLIIKTMEELCFLYLLNEHNNKMYWLINPV